MWKPRKDSSLSRRELVTGLGAAGAALFASGSTLGADAGLQIAGKPVEIQLTPASPHTFRLTVQAIQDGALVDIPDDGTLTQA